MTEFVKNTFQLAVLAKRQGGEKQVLCFNREDCACLLHNLMFLLYGFKFHITLLQSHLVNKGGSSGSEGGGSCHLKCRQPLAEATVPRSMFLQLQGPVSFRSTA